MSRLLNPYRFGEIAPPVPTTWNPSDKSASALLTNGNLTVENTANDGNSVSVRSVASKTSGKHYWECTVDVVSATATAIGVATASYALNGTSGLGAAVVNSYSTGIFNINNVASAGPDFGTGAVIRIALNKTTNKIWFAVNSGLWNESALANPETDTGGHDISALSGALFALVAGFYVSRVTANFGASSFAYTVPAGFNAGFLA